MTKVHFYIIIGLLAGLMLLGALWQHGRYEALNSQLESLSEANSTLVEGAKKGGQVSIIKDASSTRATQLSIDNQQKTQKRVEELANVVEKGNTNEKALMSSLLPDDVISVLDATYQDRDEVGTNP